MLSQTSFDMKRPVKHGTPEMSDWELNNSQIARIRMRYAHGATPAELAEDFGVHLTVIWEIVNEGLRKPE